MALNTQNKLNIQVQTWMYKITTIFTAILVGAESRNGNMFVLFDTAMNAPCWNQPGNLTRYLLLLVSTGLSVLFYIHKGVLVFFSSYNVFAPLGSVVLWKNHARVKIQIDFFFYPVN